MKQELKQINDWLFEYVGQKMTPELHEIIVSRLLKQKQQYLGYKTFFQEVALVWLDDKNGNIKAIGGSLPNDIISDQFGKFLADMFDAVSGVVTSVVLLNSGGVGKTVKTKGKGFVFETFWNIQNVTGINGSQGCNMQVGSGNTAPTRADLGIETPFGSAPENARKNPISTSVYNATLGRITQSVTIGATGGAGTVNEAVLFFMVRDIVGGTGTPQVFNFAHDAISPGVSFIAAENINVSYTIQI